jgi:hypothetical protein
VLSQLSYSSHCKKVGLEPTTSGLAGLFFNIILAVCAFISIYIITIFLSIVKEAFLVSVSFSFARFFCYIPLNYFTTRTPVAIVTKPTTINIKPKVFWRLGTHLTSLLLAHYIHSFACRRGAKKPSSRICWSIAI